MAASITSSTTPASLEGLAGCSVGFAWAVVVIVVIGEAASVGGETAGGAEGAEAVFTRIGVPPFEIIMRELAGRQSVVTPQFVQLKLICPVFVPLAVPEKTPAELMVTPEKSIHPIFSPQAEPESVPSELFATPDVVGFNLIQP